MRWRLVLVGTVVLMGSAFVCTSECRLDGAIGPCDGLYSKTQSPNGRFMIEVRRCRMLFAFPGQGGDAPGYVRLIDLETHRVLQRAPIDMVNTFPGATWSGRRVSIQLFAEWELPASSDEITCEPDDGF